MGRFYRHLSFDERRKIHLWREEKLSIEEIAHRLGRHKSTLYRELRRNTIQHEDKQICGYFHTTAHHFYHKRRQQLQKLERYPEIIDYIREQLRIGWSPEQISGVIKHHRNDLLYVCHETIYRYIYSAAGKELNLYQYLYRSRKHRARRYMRMPRSLKGLPKNMLLKARPDIVDGRREFGHWEADLMIFKREHGKANITTLTERKTRYTVLLKNESRHSTPVMRGIRHALIGLPSYARRTVTFDRGSEFLQHNVLTKHTQLKSYYCDPRAPWQKGTVENTNKRIRRYLPRETNLNAVSDYDIYMLYRHLNSIPRKCLGYLSPEQAFKQQLEAA